MDTLLAELTVTMAEFTADPAAILRRANGRPVAVVDGDNPAFYMLEPGLLEVLLDELADRDLHQTVLSRLADKSRLVEVSLDDL